ncbi:MAG: YebC/PmpR family DNA-binding transcriptional regulator [Patescibacteria group bacterium]
MSGHSKWRQIKRQKGASDEKKGKIFSKLIRAVTIAAKEGGADPAANFKLRLAIEKARAANMPQDNIERAVKKATGEGSSQLESIMYEAYGPGGIALLVEALSDNRNRTTSEIKNILAKNNGRLGEANSVRWLFEEKGVIIVDPESKSKDEIELVAIDAGAEDIQADENEITVITNKEDCQSVKNKLAEKYKITAAEIQLVAKNKVEIESEKKWQSIQNLIESLEEQEDVNQVYTNIA